MEWRSMNKTSLKKVAVLGAGYMGGAMTFPISENGITVNLWGTWLDDEILDSCRKGYHPRLKKGLPENVNLYGSADLKASIADVDVIFMAVSSEGFLPVFRKLVACMDRDAVFFTLTKGFVIQHGKVRRPSQLAQALFREKFPDRDFCWVSIGGPVKAVELSDRVPTASVYGMNTPWIKDRVRWFATDTYRIFTTEDVIGVEISATFKNVYAMAIGICDGMYASSREGMYHNFNSLLFTQGVKEMSLMVSKAGGKEETVFDLAGAGDLYVTAQSGRNRKYGELVGKGAPPDEAYQSMLKDGELAEGYHALKHGVKWVKELDRDLMKDLPLLNCLYHIIFLQKDPAECLRGFVRIHGG
jgi:glycerol-3-phosphate dehydrogenase (NAD(P)+)